MTGPGRPAAAGWHREFMGPAYWPVADWEYTSERTGRELDYLRRHLAAGAVVLDAGCGLGRHAIGLSLRGWRVIAVDCHRGAVAEAARRASAAGARLARFACADLFDAVPLRDASVTAAICVQAFGWGSEADQRSLLGGLRRVLAPGGMLVLDVTNPIWIFANYQPSATAEIGGVRYSFERCYDVVSGRSSGSTGAAGPGRVNHDIRLYTVPEVSELLTSAGFTVQAVDADFGAAAAVGLDTRYVQFVATAR